MSSADTKPRASAGSVPRWLAAVVAGWALLVLPTAAPAMEESELPREVPTNFVTASRFALDAGVHGIDGTLELQVDDRLTAANRPAYQQMYWFGTTFDPAVEASVMAQPLVLAQLRILDTDGGPLSVLPLPSPFVELQLVRLSAAEPQDFLVLVRKGGFGEFNGVIGYPIAVVDGRIRALQATDALSHAAQPFEMQRTVRTDWRLQPARASGGVDILQVACTPEDASDEGFRETYARYHREGGEWLYDARLERGYCTWSGDFPPRDRFP